MNNFKIASDIVKNNPRQIKYFFYGKEEQLHNPCGFVTDIYIDRYTIDR